LKKQVSPVVAVVVILVVVVVVALLWNHFSAGTGAESVLPEKGMRRPPPSAADIAKWSGKAADLAKEAQKQQAAANERVAKELKKPGGAGAGAGGE
jgi:hypothetical protein